MDQGNWDIVCCEYLRGFREKYLTLHLDELTIARQEDHLKKLKELLDSPSHFTSVIFQGEELKELIITEFKDHPFEGRIVKIHKLYCLDIKKSFHTIQHFYLQEKRRFLIDVNSSDFLLTNTLERINFKKSGSRLVAKVNESLKLIEDMNLEIPSDYSFRRPQAGELDKVISIELDVHAHEPTSVLNSVDFDKKEIKRFCEKLINDKKIWGLYKSQELIGFIGYGVKDDSLGLIANIAVVRNHQGARLSYHLYRKALLELQSLELDNYYGFSATHKVLKQAGKIGRDVFEHQYEYRVAL